MYDRVMTLSLAAAVWLFNFTVVYAEDNGRLILERAIANCGGSKELDKLSAYRCAGTSKFNFASESISGKFVLWATPDMEVFKFRYESAWTLNALFQTGLVRHDSVGDLELKVSEDKFFLLYRRVGQLCISTASLLNDKNADFSVRELNDNARVFQLVTVKGGMDGTIVLTFEKTSGLLESIRVSERARTMEMRVSDYKKIGEATIPHCRKYFLNSFEIYTMRISEFEVLSHADANAR